MTIDANLIEGLKIGFAIGLFLMFQFTAWAGWQLYKRWYQDGLERTIDRGKEGIV